MKFNIAVGDDFSFFHTISSHGWSSLLPFEIDTDSTKLTYTFDIYNDQPVTVEIVAGEGELIVEASRECDATELTSKIDHSLRLKDDLTEFYIKTVGNLEMCWINEARAGRLLRSPTVFEELIKTMCTTNCSWAMTKIMVTNFVTKLGRSSESGSFAFPPPERFRGLDESFYRQEIKAGYRAPYFVELINKILSGEIDQESWLTSQLSTKDLKNEIKSIKGVGDYAADNLLKLLGRYDGLALDSFLRGQFYKKYKNGKKCPDTSIIRHYKKFGQFQGLAIWCDMTKEWFDQAKLKEKTD